MNMKTVIFAGLGGLILLGIAVTALHSQAKETPACALPSPSAREEGPMTFKIVKSDEEWKRFCDAFNVAVEDEVKFKTTEVCSPMVQTL